MKIIKGSAGMRVISGQSAPNFSLPDESGHLHNLADYRGILLFYTFILKAVPVGFNYTSRDGMNPTHFRKQALIKSSAISGV